MMLWTILNSMPTIQIVIDEELLRNADDAAAESRTNRSALIREALAAHLEARRIRALEEADRKGYERFPVESDPDLQDWEEEAVWPEP